MAAIFSAPLTFGTIARSASQALHPGLRRGIVGAWVPALGPTGGGLFDVISGNRNALTQMDPATDWVVTEKGYTLDFDTVNSPTGNYIDLGTKTYLTAGQTFSICWWERINGSAATFPDRFSFDVAGSADYFVVIRATHASYVDLTFGKSPIGAAYKAAIGTVAASIGIWKFCVITGVNPVSEVSAHFAVFADARSIAVTSAAAFGTVTLNRIGVHADHGPNCKLGTTLVYNRRITGNEILLLYTDHLAPFRRRDLFVPGRGRNRRRRFLIAGNQ